LGKTGIWVGFFRTVRFLGNAIKKEWIMLRRTFLGSFLLIFVYFFIPVVSADARDVVLQWDANMEPDLAGYKVYYQADSPTAPFNGTGAVQGSSPIDVKNQTTTTINGLDPAKTYYFAVTAYNTNGKESSYSNIVSEKGTTTPGNTNSTASTIWPSNAVPGLADAGADSPVELGVKFRSDTNGTISGIRFYKASANTGNHVANLWSSSGQLLATATFTNETPYGWQQANFSTPVAITANTYYVASYFCPAGHYSDDLNDLTNGMDYSPLHVPANGGVYAYGSSSTFPNQLWNASNYWVDVAFNANNSSSDTTAPTVSIIAPSNSTISGTTTVSISASDNVGVTKVELYISGALAYTGNSASSSYSWNTTSVANGTYTLLAKAYDAAGNVGQSTSKSVTVSNQVSDSTAPTASITSPVSNSTVSGNVTVNISASDNVGVSKVELYINNSLRYAGTSANCSYTWNTAAEVNDQYTLVAKAYDIAGNVGQSSNVFAIVNNTTRGSGSKTKSGAKGKLH
jgi:chitinase